MRLFFLLTVHCLFILIAGCTAPQSKTDSSAVENVPSTEMEMVPYENPVWIDNFLSADRKDTLRIQIWSETNKQFISEVPNDTTNDWWCWFQEQNVMAVLNLKDVEPLYLRNVYALAQCYPITEGDKRAIVIVPYVAQPSYWVSCDIYTINDNKWKGLKSFGIALWDNDGTESLRKCLIKKDGRWMYADQSDIDIEAKENPYHYLFD